MVVAVAVVVVAYVLVVVVSSCSNLGGVSVAAVAFRLRVWGFRARPDAKKGLGVLDAAFVVAVVPTCRPNSLCLTPQSAIAKVGS